MRLKQSECGVMLRTLKNLGDYPHDRVVGFAGAFGLVAALMAVEAIDAYLQPLTSL